VPTWPSRPGSPHPIRPARERAFPCPSLAVGLGKAWHHDTTHPPSPVISGDGVDADRDGKTGPSSSRKRRTPKESLRDGMIPCMQGHADEAGSANITRRKIRRIQGCRRRLARKHFGLLRLSQTLAETFRGEGGQAGTVSGVDVEAVGGAEMLFLQRFFFGFSGLLGGPKRPRCPRALAPAVRKLLARRHSININLYNRIS
jgi:hypothetical protein